jgi:hypothetical protein
MVHFLINGPTYDNKDFLYGSALICKPSTGQQSPNSLSETVERGSQSQRDADSWHTTNGAFLCGMLAHPVHDFATLKVDQQYVLPMPPGSAKKAPVRSREEIGKITAIDSTYITISSVCEFFPNTFMPFQVRASAHNQHSICTLPYLNNLTKNK